MGKFERKISKLNLFINRDKKPTKQDDFKDQRNRKQSIRTIVMKDTTNDIQDQIKNQYKIAEQKEQDKVTTQKLK